jgi:hypothetical protein
MSMINRVILGLQAMQSLRYLGDLRVLLRMEGMLFIFMNLGTLLIHQMAVYQQLPITTPLDRLMGVQIHATATLETLEICRRIRMELLNLTSLRTRSIL